MNRLNILLVIPKVSYAWEDWPVPPIGTAYVSSYLKNKGFDIYNLNLNLLDRPYKELERLILDKEIDVVASGDLAVNFAAIKKIIDCAKKVKKEIVTVIGGGFVTHSPFEAMEIIETADYGIIGEGEETAYELLTALSGEYDENSLTKIDGIIFRQNSGFCKTTERSAIKNIDELPWPDYDGFQLFDMIDEMAMRPGERSALITTSRSCPFSCTFCSKSGGASYRQRSIGNIFEEIEYLVNEKDVKRLFLNDELFAADRQRIEEFCKRIKPYSVKWIAFLRISKYLTEEIFILMKDSGCDEIFYGIESGNDDILKSMKKGITAELTAEVLKMTKKAGIKSQGGCIFGDKIETMKSVEESLEWMKKHLDLFARARCAPIICYPGSELYDYACQKNIIKSKTKHIIDGCPPVNVSQMSDQEYSSLLGDIIPKWNWYFDEQKWKTYAASKCVRINGFAEHKYVIAVKCGHCGGENIFTISPKLIKKQEYKVSCCRCGEEMYIDILTAYLSLLAEVIDAADVSLKGTFFWGFDFVFNKLLTYSERLNKETVIVIDSNRSKQKAMNNLTVISPDEIEAYDVKNIIFCFEGYEDIAERLIAPNINVIGISQIMSHYLGVMEE